MGARDESLQAAGAVLDVWQAQTSGLYDSQDTNLQEMHMRGKFHTDAEGRYLVRTVRPDRVSSFSRSK